MNETYELRQEAGVNELFGGQLFQLIEQLASRGFQVAFSKCHAGVLCEVRSGPSRGPDRHGWDIVAEHAIDVCYQLKAFLENLPQYAGGFYAQSARQEGKTATMYDEARKFLDPRIWHPGTAMIAGDQVPPDTINPMPPYWEDDFEDSQAKADRAFDELKRLKHVMFGPLSQRYLHGVPGMAPMIAGEPLKAGAIVHTEANECFEWMTPAEPAPLEDQEGADTPHGSTEESSTEWFQRVMGQS